MMLKPVLFSILCVALSDHPVTLLSIMMTGCIVSCAYVFLKKPFKSKFVNILIGVMEVAITLLIILLLSIVT